MQKPEDRPLFGAEDLRKIERITEEIERNGKAGQQHQPMPLFASSKEKETAAS